MTKPAMFWMVKGDGPAVVCHESRAVAESELPVLMGTPES